MTDSRHPSSIRRIVIALFLLGALAAPAAEARSRPGPAVRALVVRVEPHALVLRSLDGSTERITVPKRASVSLDGRPVALTVLQPGDVVIVVRRGRGAVIEILAFSA